MFTEEAIGSLVGALRSLPPRDAAEEPETLEVLRVQMSERVRVTLESAGVRFGVNILQSRPNGQALRAQQHQRFVSNGAQFGEQPSQRK